MGIFLCIEVHRFILCLYIYWRNFAYGYTISLLELVLILHSIVLIHIDIVQPPPVNWLCCTLYTCMHVDVGVHCTWHRCRVLTYNWKGTEEFQCMYMWCGIYDWGEGDISGLVHVLVHIFTIDLHWYSCIHSLNLNRIGDAGAQAIARSLHHWSDLQELR